MTIVLTFLNAIIFDFNKFLLIASGKKLLSELCKLWQVVINKWF